ncbi:ABC transporter permease [Novosphingobium sp.]|uniref:ABC transporter permease n=1 Tax=Novosphingobium sp. TaxID=1874826 RepID=UPI003D0A9FD1
MTGISQLRRGWQIQQRVIVALIVRELLTRFGRENIGFLWMMAEPLLFAGLVGTLYNYTIGTSEHGIGVVAFIASGYIPLTVLRNSFGRCIHIFAANSALLYHRQVKILDFVVARFAIEMIGGMMAYLFIGILLYNLGLFPLPSHLGFLLGGWALYMMFIFSVCLIIAPLSEMSEALEKLMPVTVYVAIPFSGTFNMASWLSPTAREVVLYSPMVNAMEMMRYGLFGGSVRPYYNVWNPVGVSMGLAVVGFALINHVRRILTVE